MFAIEVCVPDSAQFEIAAAIFSSCPRFFTVRQTSIVNASHRSIATAGNSFGGMSGGVDGAVNTHLSSYTPCEYVQDRVKAAIVEQFAGELPVGAAVVVATAHPRHTTLIYAPTMRVPGPLPEDTIVPYLAFRAVLVALKRSGMRSVSTPLFGTGAGEVPVAKACRQMLRAAASVEACGRTMLQPNELFSMHRDHRELLAL